MAPDDSLPTARDPGPRDLAIRAAWLYYVEGLTQEAVAKAMRVSRAKVARLLSTARDDGIVTIDVAGRDAAAIALERRLAARYGLDKAVVVTAAHEDDVARTLGHAAAGWLAGEIASGMSLGIGWGATLSHAVDAVASRAVDRLAVVSLLGGMTHSRGVNPSTVARRLADALGAECYQLTAPLIVSDPRVRDALWREPGLAGLARRARRLDLAVVSVGDVSDEATLFREGLLPRSELAVLRAAGAVGDVLCQFLDRHGKRVDHPLARRVVAVDLGELARLPRVAIVSGGLRKAAALHAALAATHACVLVTDTAAARALVDQ